MSTSTQMTMPLVACSHIHGPTMENGKAICDTCLIQGRPTLLTPKKAKNGPHKGQWYINCSHGCHPPNPSKPSKQKSKWFFWPKGIKPLGLIGDGPVESIPSTPSFSLMQHPLSLMSFSSSSFLHLDGLLPPISVPVTDLPSHPDWVLPMHSYPIQPNIPSFPSLVSSSTNNPLLSVPQSQPPPAPLSLPPLQPLPQLQPAPGTFNFAKHWAEHLTDRQRSCLSVLGMDMTPPPPPPPPPPSQPYVLFAALDAASDNVARLLAAMPQDEAQEDNYVFLNDPLPESTPPPLHSLVMDIAVPDDHPDAPRHTDHLNKLWQWKWEYSHDGHVRYRYNKKEYFSRTQAGKRAFDMYFWLQKLQDAQCILRPSLFI
ncbi:hypothetical protein CONPUDRAFT_71625 [Coniophora puteana RWD-64-598 SS2]|uniref:Uncharacterized protein n=1 Tax=Coniophora puteana (strain RWD-64-598) TaxID=741705 RepID=A0A5M3MV34_CONPW|nr:uncharacterized protein CONPUDRAFT_71625 [Coniophora puteana RWD-64-598 SS2]EIW82976.1 hypothetical protein CONPUDRAFT_71625 [Coniophora puteana RWD-64-598 SS2]